METRVLIKNVALNVVILKPVVFGVLHNATPKSREEDSGTPNQKNLVIFGKSVSVGEKGLVVVPALETQSKTKAQQAESHDETSWNTDAQMTSHWPQTRTSSLRRSVSVQF